MSPYYLVTCVLVLCGLAVGTEENKGLKCYICNSSSRNDGSECKDKNSENFGGFLKDCATEYPDVKPEDFKFCRLQTQKVEQYGETYDIVHRDCGIDGENRCVERAGTKNIRLTYCECKGDGCNSAVSVFISPALTIIALVVTMAACW